MSIKIKLSCAISLIVAVILGLNIAFTYWSTNASKEAASKEQMETIAKHLAATVDTLESNKQHLELELGEKLRLAAIAAKERLGPQLADISNNQLAALAEELGIGDLTLWQRIDGEIISQKSSNPDEIGLNSHSWDYWNTAFHQLLDGQDVTVPQGQKLPHFWTGPINFAVSNPQEINKWGYYFDGTTDYMIDTIAHIDYQGTFDMTSGTNALIAQLQEEQNNILEITGFNPAFFGTKPIIKLKKGVPVYNLDVRDISFGTYSYKNTAEDAVLIQRVLQSGETATISFETNGQHVLRSFIPIEGSRPYVIGVAFDEHIVHEQLDRQLAVHSFISLLLFLFTVIASYFVAGYMIRSLNQIVYKVNAIAAGNFDAVISINNKDELGLLASRVNTMGTNLSKYTTQLKETASELRSTKQYLESFVDHTSDAIHVVDLEDRVIQVNNAFVKMFGWTPEETMRQVLDNVPEEHLAAHCRHMAVVLGGGSIADIETVRYQKSGNPIDVSVTISSIRDEEENIVAIATISRNITARKQTEEMIRRSEKLSIVGQLAAGVAHEVRNPLTTLKGFVQLSKSSGKLSEVQLDLMLSELDQINMIVSEFLVLAKPHMTRIEQVQLVDALKNIAMLLESEAKLNHVMLELRVLSPVPEIRGIANQLKQVFVNIVKNGIEAMSNGGTLTIEIGANENDSIVIQFIDQGIGIEEEHLERMGEPFFTTKESGNGLGLMVSHQIISSHNGTMSFRSKKGQGTCVEILLPIRHE
ncbi:ATP-binding protein [Paenibacillus sp. HB172176]|uniref:ATP-binding protein n=1 Tax=Paenibacillus sp. HB172176 TaxID=2493690 RepID=UPI001F105CDB|nr:ATP-binding protein [Paenibacillus sp. HB172176]